MKYILLFMSFFSTSYCYSQEWKLVTEVKNGSYYYKPNTNETAWIKIISDKTEYYPTESPEGVKKTVDGYQLVLWKFDCISKKLGLIQTSVYSKDGTLLNKSKQNDVLVEMEYVIPETLGEEILKAICQ